MWVDIFPVCLGDPGTSVDIYPRQPTEYVLRLVVWNTFDVILDETNLLGEKMSDIYVKVSRNPNHHHPLSGKWC